MDILFFVPYFNQPRGNSTTIKRLVHFLQQEKMSTSVVPYLENDRWHRSEADVYHILHATRFLQWAKENHFIINRPYIVTMGGTDINIDLQTGLEDDMYSFLNHASFITVFTEDAKEKVKGLSQGWADKTFVIPQGIWMPWEVPPLKETLTPHIFLPAGLRPVKDVLHVLPSMDELASSYPDLNFTILGAKLNDSVRHQVKKIENKFEWFNYAGVVPYEVMKLWYEKAQIVINTSISEGQSLAIMEAMAAGRPVIARKNEANLQFISHEQTGWLYETMDEFTDAVHSIVNNSALREKVIRQAKEQIAEHHSPEKEIQAYIDLYKKIK